MAQAARPKVCSLQSTLESGLERVWLSDAVLERVWDMVLAQVSQRLGFVLERVWVHGWVCR